LLDPTLPFSPQRAQAERKREKGTKRGANASEKMKEEVEIEGAWRTEGASERRERERERERERTGVGARLPSSIHYDQLPLMESSCPRHSTVSRRARGNFCFAKQHEVVCTWHCRLCSRLHARRNDDGSPPPPRPPSRTRTSRFCRQPAE
jgi:hypothetical protein